MQDGLERELKDLIKDILDYRMKLEAELKGTDNTIGLEDQLEELKERYSENGALSIIERNKLKKITARIEAIKDYFKKCEELIKYEQAKLVLKELTSKLTKEEKQAKIEELTNILKNMNSSIKKEIAEKLGCEVKDLDINKAKKNIEEDLMALETNKVVLEKRNENADHIEDEISDQKDLLDLIENYLNTNLDENQIRSDLKTLSNSKTKKEEKEAIFNKYQKIIEDLEKELASELSETENKEKNKKVRKEEIKDLSNKLTNWFKEHKRRILAVTGSVILLISITMICKSCKNANTKTSNTVSEATMREWTKTLMEMGFDELTATRFAHTPGFNLDYLGNYLDAINSGIIEIDKAVDYVNRAYKIQETKFFDDASILDIVEIIDGINRQENKKIESTSIIGTLTDIYNKYQYQTLTQEDVNKLDAFLYFAKDDSDLDKFLTEYASIAKQVLNAKNDKENSNKAKNDMYNYLNVFANTYAGYVVEGEFTNPNINAIVKDTDDWAIAYASFVRPLISMNITPENAEAFGCLQINMLSNYEQWAQVNGCDHTLTLGK